MLLNRARCQAMLEEHRLDALVATQPANVMYLGNFFSLSHWFIAGVHEYAVVEPDNARPPTVFAPVIEMDQVTHVPEGEVDFRPTGRFVFAGLGAVGLPPDAQRLKDFILAPTGYPQPLDGLVDLLRHRHLTRGRVGIDELGIAPDLMAELRAAMPAVEWVPAAAIFKRIRAVKTPAEIERLERAAQITEAAIEAALASAREGMTEKEMAAEYNGEIGRLGGRQFLSVIGFGYRSSFPNNPPSENRLRRGDIIRFDVGCAVDGYSADTARIAVFGEAEDRVLRYQEALVAGEEAALRAVRPGVPASELFRVAVEEVRRTIPHYDRTHVGHGIGIDIYEPPVLTAEAEGELLEGMVLNVETPYYEFGLGGLQVEDTIVVTVDGYRSFTRLPKQVIRVG